MSTPELRHAILRLMRYGTLAYTARYSGQPEMYWDLRTSTDDCRIAIRAAAGEQLELLS